MRLYGLIGYPLGHSFSQKYFTAKFAREGITDCRYELFPLPDVRDLPDLLQRHPDLKGLNVTIPHKQAVVPYLNHSHLPEGLPACNCIRIDDGQLTGYNTDAIGFEKTFLPLLRPWHQQALILGSGGASQAIRHVLRKLGLREKVVGRHARPGVDLTYEQLTPDLLQEYGVIINCSPVGTYPDVDSCPDIPYEGLTPQHYLYDLVYNPEKTTFLQKGEAIGATIRNGHDMLVVQAEESWRIWSTSD